MDMNIIDLFSRLILSFISIVAPIYILLLSIFREGLNILSTRYENENAQIQDQVKNLAKKEGSNLDEIEKALKERTAKQRIIKKKLFYLDPIKQTLNLFIPLLLSYGIVAAYYITTGKWSICFMVIAALLFIRAIYVLFVLLITIIEVKKAIDDNIKTSNEEQRKTNEKIIELLSALAKNEKPYFIKDVYLCINGQTIDQENKTIELKVGEKNKIKISIWNKEKLMAKNIEVGLVFPLEYIIEKPDSYSIYTSELNQIVRYETSSLQGQTDLRLKDIIITPTKPGVNDVKSFIKAENIESISRMIIFNVK